VLNFISWEWVYKNITGSFRFKVVNLPIYKIQKGWLNNLNLKSQLYPLQKNSLGISFPQLTAIKENILALQSIEFLINMFSVIPI